MKNNSRNLTAGESGVILGEDFGSLPESVMAESGLPVGPPVPHDQPQNQLDLPKMNSFRQFPDWMEHHPKGNDPDFVSVVAWLSILARFKLPRQSSFHGKTIELSIGQLTLGRKQLSARSGVSESKCFRILKRLKGEQRVTMETDNQCTLITCNWINDPKEVEQRSYAKVNNERTTSEQRVNTLTKDHSSIDSETEAKTLTESSNELSPSAPEEASELVQYLRSKWKDIKDPVGLEDAALVAYPAVDLIAEARKAYVWEQCDKTHRKTNHGKFINNWWSKAQQDANRNRTTAPFTPVVQQPSLREPPAYLHLPEEVWEAYFTEPTMSWDDPGIVEWQLKLARRTPEEKEEARIFIERKFREADLLKKNGATGGQ